MKTKNKVLSIAAAGLLGLGMTSCTDGNDWGVDGAYSRLFSVDNSEISIEAGDVSATVVFKTIEGAKYYILEVSTDSLYDDIEMGQPNAIVYGEDMSITKSPFVMEGLNGDTKYYLRIKSKAEGKNDSKWSYYREGRSFKTLAEQIFMDPVASDRSESTLHVAWTPDAEVTDLVVTESGAEEPVVIALDDAAKAAGEYTITGLKPSTNYTIVIKNGEVKRGTLTLSTTAAMPEGDYKTEIAEGITRIDADVINGIVEEAKAATGKNDNFAITIGLRPDVTYDIAAYAEDGGDASLVLPDQISFTFFGMSGGEAPVLNMIKSLGIAGGHTYIRFENVVMADGGCQYFINQSTSASVNELAFTQCEFADFSRSFIRVQGSEAFTFGKIIVDNCIFTNMITENGYAVFRMDTNATTVGSIEIKNSTFDTSQHNFFQLTNSTFTDGIYISDCTFYNNVAATRYFMDANGTNINLTMKNTILGRSYDEAARGIRTAGTLVFDNCLRTSDCIYGSNDIKDLTAGDKSSADVFKDPENHDFTLKINDLIGDPRWYPTE